jgi:hypothetical protein
VLHRRHTVPGFVTICFFQSVVAPTFAASNPSAEVPVETDTRSPTATFPDVSAAPKPSAPKTAEPASENQEPSSPSLPEGLDPLPEQKPFPSESPGDDPKLPVYRLSVRTGVGFGRGNLGFGARGGVSAEYWLTRSIGVGVVGALLAESNAGFLGSGTQDFESTQDSARILAPLLAVRSAPRDEYFLATLGAGYASVSRTEWSGSCFGICPPNPTTRYDEVALDAAAGWLTHPAPAFELGLIGRVDVMGGFRDATPVDYLFTLNLEFGFAWLAH